MIHSRTIAGLFALIALATTVPASAGDAWVEQRLLADEGQTNDLAGFRVLVSGDIAFVSVPSPIFRPGEVHVFERANGAWQLTQVLTATPGEAPPPNWSNFFGWSLSLSGNTLIVGAPQRFHPMFGPVGAAYVFTESDGTWTQQQELMSDPVQPNQWFGSALAVVDDTAVIGAYTESISAGAAYVFSSSGGIWTQQQRLAASDGQPGTPTQFGGAIAFDGTTMLIGAPGPDFTTGTHPPGAAYVFGLSGEDWTESQKLTGADDAGDQFGFSVALSGSTALIGAPQEDVDGATNQGAAHVFGEAGGTWTHEQELTLDAGEDFDQFGQSVELQGDTALVGEWSHNSDPNGPQAPPKAGRAHLFARSAGTWTAIQELTPNDGSLEDSFGWYLSIDGSTLLVGATGIAPGGNPFQGAAYAFFMPPPDHGILEGTVQSLGYCGASPAPLAGATVEIAGNAGTAVLQANENGFYQASLPAADGPVDITVSAPGHLPTSVGGIVLAAGETVLHAFELDLAAPCETVDPASITVDLAAGENTTETLTIGNADGSVDLEWSVSAAAPPAARAAWIGDGGPRRAVSGALIAPGDLAGREYLAGLPNAQRLTETSDLAASLHPLPGLRPGAAMGDIDCDGEPGLIVHDDGTVENGYSGIAGAVSEVRFADRFTPLAYPAPLSAVCLTFLTQGPTSLTFDIVIYDDDGPGGAPGTELGSLPVTADGIPNQPGSPIWFGFDISSLDLMVTSGSVYVGARWAPAEPGVFIAADESAPNPPGFAGGYWWNDDSGAWSPIEGVFATYRSLMVRTVANSGGCVDPTEVAWLSLDPASGVTAAAGSSEVGVSIDAGGLAAGTYEANLCIASNDPQRPLVTIPVSLTVSAVNFSPFGLAVDPVGTAPGANGIFEPGETVDIAPTWRNDSDVEQGLGGTASSFTGPASATYGIDSDTADYGSIQPADTASCLVTAVCYRLALDAPAVRPVTHWDATFDEALDDVAATTETWTIHIGGSFADVPSASPFYPAIEGLLHSGVTGGCDGSSYCPGDSNTRSQMPVFMLRALEGVDYTPPACADGSEIFNDVPFSNGFCPWIQELADRGIVAGCGDGNYCPGAPVTRAQMAIFLLKTLEGDGYQPPTCTGVFDDVNCPSLFADWIEDLAARGITSGCTATEYCPGAAVTRGQMAVFVTSTFGLTLYGP